MKSIVIGGNAYCFYRAHDNDEILVNVFNGKETPQNKYAIIDVDTYNRLAQISGYYDYDSLRPWY